MTDEEHAAWLASLEQPAQPLLGVVSPPPSPAIDFARIAEEVTVQLPQPELQEGATREVGLRNEDKDHATRINPDSPKVLIFAIVLVFVLMASSFVVSFFGIWGISEATTNIPTPLTWVPALFLDAAILAYTISYFVFQARGENVVRTRIAMWAFALISVASNVAHTAMIFTPQTPIYEMIIGIVITGSAPIAVVMASEEIARLAFKQPRRSARLE